MKPIRYMAPMIASCAFFLCGCQNGSKPVGGDETNVSLVSADPAVNAVMQRVFPALVRIYAVKLQPENGRMQRLQTSGSGAIISPDGYVVTNHHVAGTASRIVVHTVDREEIEATLVGTDPLADIAVLKLNLATRKDPSKPLPHAAWGDSSKVRIGDVVFAMGSPAAVAQSVTRGIVAHPAMIIQGGTRQDGESVGEVVRWIAHDAVIYYGNSGGPLVNTNGEIIGVNEIGFASLGGAIPANTARPVVEALIQHGDVPRSWIGLEVQPRLKGDTRDSGGLVSSVLKDSPAGAAGLEAGDLILQFAGRDIDVKVEEDVPVFNQMVFSVPIGAEVPAVFERDGKRQSVMIKTQRRERPIGKPIEFKAWGIVASDLTGPQAIALRRADRDGVLVRSVRSSGPASGSSLPLQAGDILTKVGDQKIASCADLQAATANLSNQPGDRIPVLVAFDRGSRDIITVVKIGKDLPKDQPARSRKSWSAMATQVLTQELAENLKLTARGGVRVTQVFANQSADIAGIQPGDVILSIDGDQVEANRPEDRDIFDGMIRRYPVGTEIAFEILRDGTPLKLAMVTQAMPSQVDSAKRLEDTDFEFTARDLDFEDRDKIDLDQATAGVLIESVEQAGWASLGGLQGGDVLLRVNAQPIASIDQLKSVLDEIRRDKPRYVTILLRRGTRTLFQEIEPDWQPFTGTP